MSDEATANKSSVKKLKSHVINGQGLATNNSFENDCDPSPSSLLFSRRYDVASGRFYYVMKATGVATWDAPNGMDINMEDPSDDGRQATAPEKQNDSILRDKQRNERLFFIEKTKKHHRKETQKKKSKMETDEAARKDFIWKSACDAGKEDGKVQIRWQDFGYISDRIYTFQKGYGRDLTHLSIVGNGLLNIEQIPHFCGRLTYLSLASNCIKDLGDNICKLNNLLHLNLMGNRLELLPRDIGSLQQLQTFELGNNHLMDLPSSFGNLRYLNRVVSGTIRIFHSVQKLLYSP